MSEHSWTEDPAGGGTLVCSECGEWCWPEKDVKGRYHMRGRDGETGLIYSWFTYGPKPDYEGAGWPGPSRPTDVSVVEKRTIPVSSSCDEYRVSEVMDS